MKDYENYFIITCTNESFTIRPGTLIKTNKLFDFKERY